MAAAENSFSFHCMICVELFDETERYPVVLPCGHTYVCVVCAHRLDKCMECRTPLAWNFPIQKQAPQGNRQGLSLASRSGRSTSRSSTLSHRSPGQQSPGTHVAAQQFEKRRLPLPKNIVLLSLLEATEMATEHAARKKPTPESPSDASLTISRNGTLVDEEDSDDETEKIKAAFSVAAGACGTYVVADKNGRQIYPSRPAEGCSHGPATASHEDVDTLVRFFYLDQTLDTNSEEEAVQKMGTKELSPAKLNCGDRVQIVSLDDGWAKLARGYGFVRTRNNGIVKITASVDKACKLEAMLRALSMRRKALSREQSKVDTHFVGLMSDLQTSLINDEDLTVIPADTFGDAQVALESLGLTDSAVASHEDQQEDADGENTTAKPVELHRSETPPALDSTLSGLCIPDTLFDVLSHAGQTSAPALPADATDPPSPSVLSAGARAWRKRHGRPASQSIDFRTGMSGHHGLESAQAHTQDYLPPSRPMMSSYSGLTVPRSSKRRSNAELPTP